MPLSDLIKMQHPDTQKLIQFIRIPLQISIDFQISVFDEIGCISINWKISNIRNFNALFQTKEIIEIDGYRDTKAETIKLDD